MVANVDNFKHLTFKEKHDREITFPKAIWAITQHFHTTIQPCASHSYSTTVLPHNFICFQPASLPGQ